MAATGPIGQSHAVLAVTHGEADAAASAGEQIRPGQGTFLNAASHVQTC